MGIQHHVLITSKYVAYYEVNTLMIQPLLADTVIDGIIQQTPSGEALREQLCRQLPEGEAVTFIVQSSTFFYWQDKLPPATPKQVKAIRDRQHERLLGSKQYMYALYCRVKQGETHKQITSVGIPYTLLKHYKKLAKRLKASTYEVIPYDTWLSTQHPQLSIQQFNSYKRLTRGETIGEGVYQEWRLFIQQALTKPCEGLGDKVHKKARAYVYSYWNLDKKERLMYVYVCAFSSMALCGLGSQQLSRRALAVEEGLSRYEQQQKEQVHQEAVQAKSLTFATCQSDIRTQNQMFMKRYEDVQQVTRYMPSLLTTYGMSVTTERWIKGSVACAYDLVPYMTQLEKGLPMYQLDWHVASNDRLEATDFTVTIKENVDEP